MQLFSTKHKVFWAVFLAVVAVCFASAISGRQRRANAWRAVEMLRPIVAADTRFQKVEVLYSTAGSVGVVGTVSSTNDLRDLQRLIDKTELPARPSVGVRIDSNPPDIMPEATAK
jgi:hypothetical protein